LIDMITLCIELCVSSLSGTHSAWLETSQTQRFESTPPEVVFLINIFLGGCPGLLLHVLRRQQSKRRLHLRSGFHNSRLLYRRLNIAWKTASVSGDW
jgi:hypothetical protein